jgi:hypothetical protein
MTMAEAELPIEMVAAAHDAEISGGEHGRYRRIITAVWPLIAAAERERILARLKQLPGGALFSRADLLAILGTDTASLRKRKD